MAYVGTTNTISTGAAGTSLFAIKTALKLAGWSVVSSGTGTGGTTGLGDLITTGTGTALGSFNVANAWVRMREPGVGTREYIFQNGTSNNTVNALVKYSRASGFGTGGSATVAPNTNGGDGIIFYGGGTDASPTAPNQFATAAPGYIHCVASDTPTNGVYGWWWISYVTNPTTSISLMCTEGVAAGSTPAGDNDPSVRYVGTSATIPSAGGGTGTWSWWELYGLAGAAYRTGGYPGSYIASQAGGVGYVNLFTQFQSLDPYGGKVTMLPLMIGRSNLFPKGFTTETLNVATVQNLLDTYNLSTAAPKVHVSNGTPIYLAVPWVPNVVPLL